MQSILVIDTSYTLKMIKERKLWQVLEARNSGNFFDKVISVHPFSSLVEKKRKIGNPTIVNIKDKHIFISGKIGINNFLNYFPVLNFILSQIKLIKIIISISVKNKVKLIRVGDPYYIGLLGLIISKIIKVPLVIRVGGNYDEIVKISGKPMMKKLFKFRFIEKIVEKYVFSKCHLVLAANKNNAKYVQEHCSKKKIVKVIRYGNLIHPIHWRHPNKRKKPVKIIKSLNLKNYKFGIVISRLEKVKQVENIIKVASEINTKYLVKFLIIGDGSELKNLINYSKKLGIDKNIIFAGNKDQIWISHILPYCDFVLSPHGGRSLVESCLAQIPIIAYNREWQGEIIKNKKTGFLIKNNNWYGFIKKIIYILNNKKKTTSLGINARAKIIETMYPSKINMLEQKLYKNTIKNFNK